MASILFSPPEPLGCNTRGGSGCWLERGKVLCVGNGRGQNFVHTLLPRKLRTESWVMCAPLNQGLWSGHWLDQTTDGPVSERRLGFPHGLGKQGNGQESEEGVGVGKRTPSPSIPQVFMHLDFFLYIYHIPKQIKINILSFVIFFPSSRRWRSQKKKYFFFYNSSASLVAQLVKNLPAMQEILVQFLDQEDPRENG